MTMKLGSSSPLELDLDSFIHRSASSDSDDDADDDLPTVPRRTIDEILNDSDSSSSPNHHSPVSKSDSSIFPHDLEANAQESQRDETLVSANDGGASSLGSRTSSFTQVGHSYSLGRKPGRPLPPLFGRSSYKPGAALAAAAAASRSVSAPHTAAIKSRRAGSATFLKVLNNHELDSVVSDDAEMVSDSDADAGIGLSNGATPDVIQLGDDNIVEQTNTTQSYQSPHIQEVRLERNDSMLEGSHQDSSLADNELEIGSPIVNLLGTDLNEDRKDSTASRLLEAEPSLPEHNSGAVSDTAFSTLKFPSSIKRDFTSSCSSFEDRVFTENSASVKAEVEDSEKATVYSDGGEEGIITIVENIPQDDSPELAEGHVHKLQNERETERAEKRLSTPVKPLDIAEELEKKQASTGLHLEEGAAAQPMRLEGVRRGSTVLGYFDIDADNIMSRTLSSQAFRRDHGAPQVVALHSNFIAVGMSKGLIIVTSSRYSAHKADSMDTKMLMLGLQGDRSSVTSISFNQLGDLLLAGHSDGHITVWDVQRTAAAKVITGEHAAPVVHTLFLGQESRQFIAVTGDSSGLVLQHDFSSSMVPLLNRFSIRTRCIIEPNLGKVLSASPLLIDGDCEEGLMCSQGINDASSSTSLGNMVGGLVGGDAGWKLISEGTSFIQEGVVIFVTYQTAVVIRLRFTPNRPEVYAQLSKPDGVREGSIPYTAWKSTVQAHGSASEKVAAETIERVSLLAVAWDRKVQVIKMVKSELTVCGRWTVEGAAIGVAWLDDQMLVIITVTGELCLFATDGTLYHKTSLSVVGSGGDDLIMYHGHFINMNGNPEKSYHNSIAVRGASIYILGPSHLIVSRLLPWKERIQALRKAGDWMGALNMAMTIYNGEANAVIDLPRSLENLQEAIKPDLVELLLSYVDEVFSYISVAIHNQLGKMELLHEQRSSNSPVHSEMKEQFVRVGGVAVEFCVHIKKTDILFDDIYSKFVASQNKDTFLELLEPYILKDMLGFLPPEIMQALVEHYSSKGWLQRVEQCVLHMDISSLDFNQVVKLCREHGLYAALVYLFNRGLDDYRAPLEELLTVLRSSKTEKAVSLGYRMLVYLKYCFSGLAFPPGHGPLPLTRLPSLRNELLQFLLEESNYCSHSTTTSSNGKRNLYYLLELDTEATLDVLKCAFDEVECSRVPLLHDSAGAVEIGEENDMLYSSTDSLLQKTVDLLVDILNAINPSKEMSSSSNEIEMVQTWPSKKDICHLFDFIAYYMACEKVCVSKTMLNQILEYLTSKDNLPTENTDTTRKREKQLLALLEVVPGTDWDQSHVLRVSEDARFYKVCGLICTFRQQYLAALDSYMKDIEEPIHSFSFIHNMLIQLDNSECGSFRSVVISRIPELVNLNREGAFLIIIDHFSQENVQILAELHSHSKSLFLYLKTLIEVYSTGTLNFSRLINFDAMCNPGGTKSRYHLNSVGAYLERIAEFQKVIRDNPITVDDETVELYLELLCQYEQESVLHFLQTFENYRVESCLRLCQKYRITDAAAYLLERVGDVGTALLLILSGLNDKFAMLDTYLSNLPPNIVLSGLSGIQHLGSMSRIKEVNEIYDILHSCIGLCQRNSPRLDPEESKLLWFQLLDSFCIPLVGSCNDDVLSEEMNCAGKETQLHRQENEEIGVIRWRISKSHRSALVVKRLFPLFIQKIVEGMMGHVPLPTIMLKLLSDNSLQEFRDFKHTIMGMLGTYGFEKGILDTAKALIEDDAFYTMSVLKKGASHGYAPQILTCCICNCHLAKNSSSYSIRIFSCGHSTHLHCEPQDNGTSNRGFSAGCPICMPKKKLQKSRGKSIFEESALLNKSLSKFHKAQGSHALLSYESEAPENYHGHQLKSRFEILTDLSKEQGRIRFESMPQLRLAPPAIYHDKVKKGTDYSTGESSIASKSNGKPSRNRQLGEQKTLRSSIQFPLKSSIFRMEKSRKTT